MNPHKPNLEAADKYVAEVLDSSMRSKDLQNLCLAYLELRGKETDNAEVKGLETVSFAGGMAVELLELVKKGLHAVPEEARTQDTRLALSVFGAVIDTTIPLNSRLRRVQVFYEKEKGTPE